MAMTQKHIAPVLVIGATGHIGRFVVDELLAAHVPVRALSRNPESADLPADAEVVSGDLTMPESLDAALAGVSAVFLVWVAPLAHAPAAIARIAAHTRRIVYLSAPHQTPHPFFQQPNPMATMHAELERLIKAAALTYTFIRPGMFAANAVSWWAPQIRSGDTVRWPYAAAATAPIDERDIARVAAHVLSEDGVANGHYVLTGPESLTQADQVRIIGETLGRSIRFVELSPEEFRRQTSSTWPPIVVDMLLNAWHAAVGLPAYVTTSVGDLTGTPARTFRQWVDDHREGFQ
jgi:uncharacterized protein YbjT (DUF2867 family)